MEEDNKSNLKDGGLISRSSSGKPIADVDEPIINESVVQSHQERFKPKKESVAAELEPLEEEIVENAKEIVGIQERKHKVVKYGEVKKPEKVFGEAEK